MGRVLRGLALRRVGSRDIDVRPALLAHFVRERRVGAVQRYVLEIMRAPEHWTPELAYAIADLLDERLSTSVSVRWRKGAGQGGDALRTTQRAWAVAAALATQALPRHSLSRAIGDAVERLRLEGDPEATDRNVRRAWSELRREIVATYNALAERQGRPCVPDRYCG